MQNQAREPHVLLPTKRAVLPGRMLFIQVEACMTRDEHDGRYMAHRLRCGAYTFVKLKDGHEARREEGEFDSPGGFMAVLGRYLSSSETLWLVSHNLGYTLTLTNFWKAVADGHGKITDYCVDDPPVVLTWAHEYGRCRMVDARNYWHTDVSSVASATGVVVPPRPDLVDAPGKWSDYCRSRCTAVARAGLALAGIVADGHLGSFGPTIGSIAWNAYRYRFLARPIHIHASPKVLALEREGYFGGRTDCFMVGKVVGQVCVYDVNSLYPYCMSSEPSPYRLAGSDEACSVRNLTNVCRDYFAVARVGLHTANREYPKRTDDGTVFPVGGFTTTLCGSELLLALESGDVTAVGPHAWYYRDYLFGEFVEWGYTRKMRCRADGDRLGETVYKGILNSLYGKFGQRSDVWVSDHREPSDMLFGQWRRYTRDPNVAYMCRAVCGAVQRHDGCNEWIHSFPAIAAGITSHGRVHIGEVRDSLPSRTVCYQDTDSIHITEERERFIRRSNIVSDTILGRMRKLHTLSNPEYKGVKNYSCDDKRAVSGVKSHASAVADGVYTQESVQGLRVLLNHCPDGIVRSQVRRAAYPGGKPRRIYDADGWSRPIKLMETGYRAEGLSLCTSRCTSEPVPQAVLFDMTHS